MTDAGQAINAPTATSLRNRLASATVAGLDNGTRLMSFQSTATTVIQQNYTLVKQEVLSRLCRPPERRADGPGRAPVVRYAFDTAPVFGFTQGNGTLQSRSVPSIPVDARVRPSGANATETTSRV